MGYGPSVASLWNALLFFSYCLIIVTSELLSGLLLACEWSGFLSICGVFAKKGNSVDTLGLGATDSISGRAPNSQSHQVSSFFWLIIFPKKPVFHHVEAVKTQVVFSLLGLSWVVPGTGWKTRLLMHIIPWGHCPWAFDIM